MPARMFFLALLLAASSPVLADVEKLTWLAGDWCGTNHGVFNEESWFAPRDGSLVGMHRDTRNGKLAGFEFFRIVEDGDDLVFWTQPGGKPAIAFRARETGEQSVAFWNRDHDFPKRISYRRNGETLIARIDDGTDDDESMEWTWTRDCESSF